MKTYILPKEDHKWLYIFEGSLLNYAIKNNELNIVVNSVDFPKFPTGISVPNYLDWVRIKFKNFSYLKLEYDYQVASGKSILNLIELGTIKNDDELLDYGGTLKILGSECHDIPTGFTIEIVCQEIELEFLEQELFA